MVYVGTLGGYLLAFHAVSHFLFVCISMLSQIHSTTVSEVPHEKTSFCIWENKDIDRLRGNCEADQCLCFRYTDSTIPLLPKSKV